MTAVKMLPQPQRTPQTLTVTTFIFSVLLSVDLYIAVTLQDKDRTHPFLSFLPKRYTSELSLIHLVQKHFPSPHAPLKPFIEVIHNNHRTDNRWQSWAVTWISEVCRAIATNWQHFINYPSTAPSVRHLQALQFLCHPVYAHLQYALQNSFSLSCTTDRILFNTHQGSIAVYYTRQGQSKEGEQLGEASENCICADNLNYIPCSV